MYLDDDVEHVGALVSVVELLCDEIETNFKFPINSEMYRTFQLTGTVFTLTESNPAHTHSIVLLRLVVRFDWEC